MSMAHLKSSNLQEVVPFMPLEQRHLSLPLTQAGLSEVQLSG